MIVRLLLAALLCVVCSSAYACDAMRPCFADGRPIYGFQTSFSGGRDIHSASAKMRKKANKTRHFAAAATVFGIAHRNTVRTMPPGLAMVMAEGAGRIVAHPSGCPRVAFCACGALKRLSQVWGVNFKNPRSLWLAANWFRFPRTSPAPGTVAVRRHHVFVLEHHIGRSVWQVYDANSGRGRTRIHSRSIAGYVIVDPRA